MITGEMFEPVIEPFAERHRVIVPDLRGAGHSRHLPGPYTVTQQATDLADLLDRLKIESATVLGYSHGGAVAQQFALDHPQRCERLVLACTYAHNMVTTREKVEGTVAPLLLRLIGVKRFARLVVAQGLKNVPADRAKKVVDLIAEQDLDTVLPAWRSIRHFDSRSRLRDIRCRTLVIAGEKDDAVPLHHASMLHAGIPGSTLALIAGGDHALVWAHPEELIRATEQFLSTA
jgi:3-oxoadipate enol-lactonase